MAGASSKCGVLIWTVPRLVGFKLHTLAVMAGKLCRGSPKASRLRGWTWYWMLGQARLGSLRVKAPNWLGAMLMGPVRLRAYSRPILAFPHRLLAKVLRVVALRTL